MARLAAYVHVVSPEGAPCAFGPDDKVPDWAADQITNPSAWTVPSDAVAPEVEAPVIKAPARRSRAKRPTTK